MKNQNCFILLMLTCILCFNTKNLNAQTAKDVFDQSVGITYLGADFSHAKCYGESARFSAPEITSKINDVLKNEYEKYNVGEALKKSSVDVKFDMTEKLNAKISDDNFFTYSTSDLNKLKEADIQKIVSGYNLTGKGVGLIFIIDNLNKTEAKETIWVTFINMNSKKIIFTEKLTEKAGGFGIRNYWVKPIYDVIKDMKTSLFKLWSKKYSE